MVMGSKCFEAGPTMQQLEPRVLLSAVHFLHTTAHLSQARFAAAATRVGSLAMFAGGRFDQGDSGAVDIYDASTGRWSTAQLSKDRGDIGATTLGSKAIFAGGSNGIAPFDVVDIYDGATARWSTAKISQADAISAAVTVGAKALFAGAQPLPSSRVEIYDGRKDRWSTTTLSEARYSPVGTVVGSNAYFAGGGRVDGRLSDVVDVYDGSSGQWSTLKLPVAAEFSVATTAGSRAIFAGGYALNKHGSRVQSDLVEIFDARTGRWSTAKLSQARSGLAAVSVGNVALFAGGAYDDRRGSHGSDVVDIYDTGTGQWSTTALAGARANLAATAVGDTALFAGGYDLSDPTGHARATVDLFTLDSASPTPALVSAPTIDRSRKTYTFTLSYHDRNGIDRSTFDNNDVFVTGPNGFNHAANFVSQTRGKHASTRVVTYAVRGRGLRWDAGENGTYTIRLHGNQVTDTAGNAATGDDLGEFTVAIPTPPSTSAAPTTVRVQRSTIAFQAKRKISDLFEVSAV
jgi:kelch-like protein 20